MSTTLLFFPAPDRRRARRGGLCAVLMLAALSAPVAAETIPLPRPAPAGRNLAGAMPPPAAASPAAPPAAVAAPQPRLTGARLPDPIPPTQMPPRRGGALSAEQRAMLGRINAYLSSVQTLVGNFVQVGPDGKRSTGDFYIQKPGKVRFEYDAPSRIELIADGSSVAVRDRKLATQDLYPLSQTPLRFLLSDRVDLMRDAKVISVAGDDLYVSVVVEEEQIMVGKSRLMLMFDAKNYQLKQWTVTDPQGYDTTVAVYNLTVARNLDPMLFIINYERVIQ